MRLIFFLFICITLFSCQKEELIYEPVEEIIIDFPNVDQRLWPHFLEFEAEAAARGKTVDLRVLQIQGEILELHQGNVAGVCTYSSAQPNLVKIDASFWNESSYLWREMIVFHELGHCVLSRDHYEAQNTAGLCLSIMRSGNGNCRDAYSNVNRDAYLDELFYNDVNLLTRINQ